MKEHMQNAGAYVDSCGLTIKGLLEKMFITIQIRKIYNTSNNYKEL